MKENLLNNYLEKSNCGCTLVNCLKEICSRLAAYLKNILKLIKGKYY